LPTAKARLPAPAAPREEVQEIDETDEILSAFDEEDIVD
jgi:hypothetical protein